MRHRKLKTTLILSFIAVLVSGIALHVASEDSHAPGHQVWAAWAWTHSIAATTLTAASIMHIRQKKKWFRTLKIKAPTLKAKWRKADTLITAGLMSVLLITGLIMLAGVNGGGSKIGLWHYVIGYVWAAFALPHMKLINPSKNKTHGK